MIKLTDSDYRLPLVEALSPFDLMDKGTTMPLAIWGVDQQSGTRGQYVVKLKCSDRMTLSSSAFELIGAWMAMELELPVVKPVLVNISKEFVEFAMQGVDGYRAASRSIGLNFGSRYEAGFTQIPGTHFPIPKSFYETVKLLYVFDMFISNADRGHQKPNVLSNGKDLLIFDHELAFSFVRILPFLQNPTPWILNEADRDLYSKHFFFNTLKAEKPDLEHQVNMLERFDAGFWDKVKSHLPEEWLTEDILKIESHLTSIVEQRKYFAESLKRTFYP